MRRKKISELPLYTSLKGLYTVWVDENNNSAKESLEWLGAQGDDAEEAAKATNETTEKVLEKLATLIPEGLEVEYPSTPGEGDDILATLLPETVLNNVVFQSDNKSVAVAPDGKITIVGTGTSTVHVIPTCNTALYRTIRITVK